MISPTYKSSMVYKNPKIHPKSAGKTSIAVKIKAYRQARRVGKKKTRFHKLGAEEEAEEEAEAEAEAEAAEEAAEAAEAAEAEAEAVDEEAAEETEVEVKEAAEDTGRIHT